MLRYVEEPVPRGGRGLLLYDAFDSVEVRADLRISKRDTRARAAGYFRDALSRLLSCESPCVMALRRRPFGRLRGASLDGPGHRAHGQLFMDGGCPARGHVPLSRPRRRFQRERVLIAFGNRAFAAGVNAAWRARLLYHARATPVVSVVGERPMSQCLPM